jgi:hypothetical protein
MENAPLDKQRLAFLLNPDFTPKEFATFRLGDRPLWWYDRD